MNLLGLYTVLITPFDEFLKFDEKGFRANLEYQLQAGVDGVVALGTTGETPTLTQEEEEQIIRIARKETEGRVPLIVGTGKYSTQETIEKTALAKDLGADATLIISPYYNKPTQEGLFLHYSAIAEAVDIPIILYNNAARTSQNIQTSTVKRLAQIPNIIGVKESSGNIYQIMDVIALMKELRPDFRIISGDDVLTYAVMALGGHGVFSVVSNLIPAPMVEFVDHLKAGRFSDALPLHYRLLPLIHAAFLETNPIPIKTAMQLWGLSAGPCRLPLCDLQTESLIQLQNVLKQYEWARPPATAPHH